MRKLLLTTMAAAAAFVACTLASPRAEAMPLAAPGGLAAAIQSENLTQDVHYYCRRVWRCGYWGCGWRRACYGGGYYGYGYYGGYGYRPYRYYHRHWW